VREQFARLGGLDVAPLFGGVEELPGGLLGWRTRITYAVDRAGRPGLHKHGSRELEHVRACPLGVDGVGDSAVLVQTWPGLTGVEVAGAAGERSVLAHRPGSGRQARGRRPPDRVRLLDGPPVLQHELLGRRFEVAAGGFWQVHPAAAQALATALLDGVRLRPGERVLDLYAGAGAFTAVLADAVGPVGRVLGVESDARAVADAERNLADLPWAEVRRGRVDKQLVTGLDEPVDVVVLDPPRAGAGAATIEALIALSPRVIGYVSCDPATLARDAAAAARAGWQLQSLRAFDAFPMTQHVECVAVFGPNLAADPDHDPA
jgi:23S rRNA U2552 (ribose-2'-O)-methylase RlmE/FtsJ